MRAIAAGLGVVVWACAATAIAAPREFEGERAVPSEAVAEPVVAPTSAPVAAAPTPTTAPVASAPSAKKKDKHQRLPYPRLVIAGGPVIGPHSFGNEECRSEESRCETHGTFFGVGANLELRARLYKPLYAHARAIIVANASPRDPVYKGLWGAGIGVGAYARRIFGRAEYLFVDTFGDDQFARPFGTGEVGRDAWAHHAGLFSVGARLPFLRRMTGELWGGLMVGPRSTRTIPDEPVDRRTLLTFLVGINIAYDLIPARAR
jgi:hypothetical protein